MSNPLRLGATGKGGVGADTQTHRFMDIATFILIWTRGPWANSLRKKEEEKVCVMHSDVTYKSPA